MLRARRASRTATTSREESAPELTQERPRLSTESNTVWRVPSSEQDKQISTVGPAISYPCPDFRPSELPVRGQSHGLTTTMASGFWPKAESPA